MTDYKYILDYNSEWLKLADQKAVIIITVYGVLLTIIYTNPEEILKAIDSSNTILILSIIAGIASSISILFSFFCIKPTLKNDNGQSLMYFNHIKNFDSWKEYQVYSKNSDYEEALTEQIHSISKICSKKYFNVGVSIYAFLLTIVLLVAIVATYIIQ